MQVMNAVGLMSLMFSACNASYGQAATKIEFEVASVRASGVRVAGERPGPAARSGGPGTSDPVRITYSNMPLNLIVADAFDVHWDRIGLPRNDTPSWPMSPKGQPGNRRGRCSKIYS